MRRLRRLQDDPAWIADETSPETHAALERIRLGNAQGVPPSARLVSVLYRIMTVLLSLGLAGAFALGFGAPIPAWAVASAIAGGTVAMAGLFASLISLRGVPLPRRG